MGAPEGRPPSKGPDQTPFPDMQLGSPEASLFDRSRRLSVAVDERPQRA
jgi:hypothetical protein